MSGRDCGCLTVKKYGDEYHCMECYALFIPATLVNAPAPSTDLGGKLAEDYTPKHSIDELPPSESDPTAARLDALEQFAAELSNIDGSTRDAYVNAFGLSAAAREGLI